MIDREKLISIIEEVEGLYNNDFPSIEQLADGIIARLATDNNVGSKWIPVSERLPEVECYTYSVDVLFFDIVEGIHVGYSNLEIGAWKDKFSRDIYAEDKVTHWMPLPELPKEDE